LPWPSWLGPQRLSPQTRNENASPLTFWSLLASPLLAAVSVPGTSWLEDTKTFAYFAFCVAFVTFCVAFVTFWVLAFVTFCVISSFFIEIDFFFGDKILVTKFW